MALLGNLTGSSQFFNNKDFYNGVATQSLRFDDGSSAYLSRTPSSAGNRRTFTFSAWIKRGSSLDTSDKVIFGAGTGNSADFRIRLSDTNFFDLLSYNGSSYDFNIRTNQVFRDVSAWYHILVAFDTTQGTSTDRIKIYVNGTQLTSFSTATYPSQNFEGFINNTSAHALGRYSWTSSAYFDGYMAEVNLVDGNAYDPTYFGETKNGVWIPKKYTGSYGTNGFRLQFNQTGVGTASTSTIGADTSGNTHHFTSSGIVASDCNMPDSPENNFATMNPLAKTPSMPYFSEGNLKLAPNAGNYNSAFSSMGVSSGKFYFEYAITGTTNTGDILGIINSANIDYHNNNITHVGVKGYAYYPNSGNKLGNGASVSYGNSYTNDDIIGVALDMDAGKVWFAKNNTYQASGNPASGTNEAFSGLSGTYFAGATLYAGGFSAVIYNFGQDSSFAGTETAQGNTDANGIGDFYYAPPSGYLAICTSNLPEPTIGPNSATQADDYFNTVLYSGNSSNGHGITGVGFQPDWTWIKARSDTRTHVLYDSTRGAGKYLSSDNTNAEGTDTTAFASFDSDGFTVGTTENYINNSSHTYVAWNWKANGGTATATISESGNNPAASVQANATAGFSLITYTGTGAEGTIAHGLGAAPQLMIIKNRDATDAWNVFHSGKGNTHAFYLNLGNAPDDNTSFWNDTSPTSSVFTINTDHGVNADGEKYVAYVFAEVEGYSKFGTYSPNNSTSDNVFVYLGFRPAFLIVKTAEATQEWAIADNKREPTNDGDMTVLYPNHNYGDSTGNDVDFLSNGFKVRSRGSFGYLTSTYIYWAFAETPFKYANAR